MLAVAIIAVTPSANTIRPQLWTLAALAYLGWTLWGHHRFALVPVLFLLWANLHGGWIVGLGVATSWLVGRFLDDFVEAPAMIYLNYQIGKGLDHMEGPDRIPRSSVMDR